MELYARQGDLVFTRIPKIDEELTKKSNLVLAGALSAPHTVTGEVLARQDGSTTFLRVTEPVTVAHAGRHLPVQLEPGDYRASPLRERGGEGDRAVED
jgi:hypothetical protein